MMLKDKCTVAAAIAAVIVATGCGKPTPGTEANEAVAPVEAQPPEPAAAPMTVPPVTEPATTNASSAAAAFLAKSRASPFAQAGQALKESFDAALIAFQIGDYARSVRELYALARNPDLTAEQKQAVQDLFAEILKLAPETATEAAAAAAQTSGSGAGSNESLSGGARFTRQSLASPFAQADQALKEGYDAALVAFQIGNYSRAVAELDLLAEAPALTVEQRQAMQELRARTLAAAPELRTNAGAAGVEGAGPPR